MYNKTIMVGNLTRDIELRYLPSGAAVGKSSIATSHRYKTQTGEQKEEVCFLEFNLFGRSAEVANQYLKKGSRVLLEGRLVLEQWTAQDGSNRNRHSLRVENMTMLGSKNDSQAESDYGQGNYAQQNNSSSYNQNYGNTQANSGISTSNQTQNNHNIPEIDINDDEIPF